MLSVEEKKALHACGCGHLHASHDSAGCLSSGCECEDTVPSAIDTTYDAVERLITAREQAALARIAHLVRQWRQQNRDSIDCGRGLVRVELSWVVGNLEVLLAQAGAQS